MTEAEFQNQERLKKQERSAPLPPAHQAHPLGRAAALGNARVQRILRAAVQRSADDGSGRLDDSLASAIQAKRGSGQPLDRAAQTNLGAALGDDFADVRIHDDGEADQLNRALKADAFTAGTDIFFRAGKYNPGSSEGKKLLAHELTHVVQQRGASASGEMTVSSPDDASERQASDVAEALTSAAPAAGAAVARQAAVDEEEELQMSAAVERQALDEEEELPV
ncbi:MAG TPA: DUF4157 domain-containing protein [Dehalococcoidia bacterium]|nr:DUF4157 domain-containing protein [Dehalococcoidia bacterium]